MNGRPRLHREDPQRTEPLRQWSTLYRSPDSWDPRPHPDTAADTAADASGAASDPDQRDTWHDVVAEGVAVGYRVIEEQIRQGQRVAEQLGDASYGPGAMSGDVREATERMVRYSADLVALWLDFVNATFGNGDLLRSLSAGWAPNGGTPAAPPPPTVRAPAVAIEVASRQPLRVSLDLQPGAAARPLVVQPLRALAPEIAALTDVAFVQGGDAGPPTLRVRVPEDQPPGVYAGAVVDGDSGEPLGTLTARVSA